MGSTIHKKLILEDYRTNSLHTDDNAFRVKKATNTIEFPVGQFISKETVRTLCSKPGFTVEIVQKS